MHVLRKLGRSDEARRSADEALRADPFNVGALFERFLLSGEGAETLESRMGDSSRNWLELAIDYAAAGAYESALAVLERYLQQAGDDGDSPMVHYYLAEYRRQSGDQAGAATTAERAAAHPPHLCFPHRLESIAVLEEASRRNPKDARAPYYLGDLWYSKRQYEEAISCWERSVKINPDFATAWRNLGLAFFNKRGDAWQAWQAYERAFRLDPIDARVLFELDQLAGRLGHDPADRLARLEAHADVVAERDDLYLERVLLLNLAGRHSEALDAVCARSFHPWEGGEGKVPAQFVIAITELARQALDKGDFDAALELLARTDRWPKSLGEGKLAGIQENNIHHLRALAYRGKGEATLAREWFEKAAIGLSEPTSAQYYNDQPPDMIFYQGLAQRELGREGEALRRFERLVEYG